MEQAFACIGEAVKTYVGHIVPMAKDYVESMKDHADYKPESISGCVPIKCVRVDAPYKILDDTHNDAHKSILLGALSLALLPHCIYVDSIRPDGRVLNSLTINLSIDEEYVKKHYGKAEPAKDVYVIPAPSPAPAPVRTRGTGKYKTHTRKSRPVEGNFTGWYEDIEGFVDALVKKTIAPAKVDVLKNVVADHIDENAVYFERTDKDQHYMITWTNVGEVQSKTVKVYGKEVVKHLYNVHYKRDVGDESFVEIVEEE
jgi:hypothetical protein